MKTVSPATIRDVSENMQGKAFPDARAKELAEEIATLLGAVEEASGAISFDDEPLHYQAYMMTAKPEA